MKKIIIITWLVRHQFKYIGLSIFLLQIKFLCCMLTDVFSVYKGLQWMSKTQNTKNGWYITLLWYVFWTQLHTALKKKEVQFHQFSFRIRNCTIKDAFWRVYLSLFYYINTRKRPQNNSMLGNVDWRWTHLVVYHP